MDPEIVLPLHEEQVTVERRRVGGDILRVETITGVREERVEAALAREQIEIERVPVGIFVDSAPPVREEGEITIIPVVEEVLVVERRLRLREEVRLRRVRTTSQHIETLQLREQRAVISRITRDAEARRGKMEEQTIVAMFDSKDQAAAAVLDLRESNVPASAISQHSAESRSHETAPKKEGFWTSIFGGESESDAETYEQGLQRGSHVVSVRVPEDHAEAVAAILERHHPVDVDERAQTYGVGAATPRATEMRTGTDRAASGSAAVAAEMAGERRAAGTPPRRTAGTDTARAGAATEEERLPLGEEQISVGKRVVNRGTTRIRRYVIETPVEEQVALRSERVSVERRPVSTEQREVTPEFADRTIEVTESEEEAVVGKTARVREEVVVTRGTSERVETVRDTVRREEVEITKDGETERGRGTTTPKR